jgi:hypothetical protein
MTITIRNITKDNMKDFTNDHTIILPMEETVLKTFLGSYEWIIVDAPIGEELTNIMELNEILTEKEEETIKILQSAGYLFEEIKSGEFTIIDFNGETQHYNNGNGVINDDWWKGFVLHDLGYASFPFTYTEEMEDYVRFDALWTQADCEGWRECTINNNTYLVCRF